jgi:hypothetical protein
MINTSLVEEEATLLHTYMYRREQESWTWVSGRLKPGETVLSKAGSNRTDRQLL